MSENGHDVRYYNILLVYALIYMVRSAESEFPWVTPPTTGPHFDCMVPLSYGQCKLSVPIPPGITANFTQVALPPF